ncbi:MAG: response regulator [Candidatus Krumholzibacteria bacterium]|nr:response regulator [Candidatus Krumholzibacteria bacterium]
MHILVVEDDFISRRLLCRYLEPLGGADVAVNGSEAVEAVRVALASDTYYDLICLDIMMPGMSGQEALGLIRELEEENGLSEGNGAMVVMTTALEDHENIQQAFSSAADGYVVKPIEKRVFMATLVDLDLDVTQVT